MNMNRRHLLTTIFGLLAATAGINPTKLIG